MLCPKAKKGAPNPHLTMMSDFQTANAKLTDNVSAESMEQLTSAAKALSPAVQKNLQDQQMVAQLERKVEMIVKTHVAPGPKDLQSLKRQVREMEAVEKAKRSKHATGRLLRLSAASIKAVTGPSGIATLSGVKELALLVDTQFASDRGSEVCSGLPLLKRPDGRWMITSPKPVLAPKDANCQVIDDDGFYPGMLCQRPGEQSALRIEKVIGTPENLTFQCHLFEKGPEGFWKKAADSEAQLITIGEETDLIVLPSQQQGFGSHTGKSVKGRALLQTLVTIDPAKFTGAIENWLRRSPEAIGRVVEVVDKSKRVEGKETMERLFANVSFQVKHLDAALNEVTSDVVLKAVPVAQLTNAAPDAVMSLLQDG